MRRTRLFPGPLALLGLLLLPGGCAGRRAREAPAASPGEGPSSCVTARATYYADSLAGSRTASGERYDPGALTAAHRTLPFGTLLRVGLGEREVVVRVNDRGAFRRSEIDLSRAAAEEIGLVRAGRAVVRLCPL